MTSTAMSSHYIDAEGHTTQCLWSQEGALTRIHFPDDSYEAFSVNALGQVFEHTARDGVVTHYRYDEQGRLVFQGERPPQASDSNLSPNATQFAWDNADRLVAIRWPNGQIKRWQYNAYNQITLEQDELGNQTRFEYLPHSTLLKHIIYANGTSEEYRYDNIHGQVSDIINARHERYHIDYTPGGLVSQEQTFDGRRLCWEYDASGSVTKRTEYGDSLRDDTALVTTYQRDVAGRLSSKTTPDGITVTYGYDGFGRLNLADDTAWPLAWQYDKRGDSRRSTSVLPASIMRMTPLAISSRCVCQTANSSIFCTITGALSVSTSTGNYSPNTAGATGRKSPADTASW